MERTSESFLEPAIAQDLRFDGFLRFCEQQFPDDCASSEAIKAQLCRLPVDPILAFYTVISVDRGRRVISVEVGKRKRWGFSSMPRRSFEIVCTQAEIDRIEVEKREVAELRRELLRVHGRTTKITVGFSDGSNVAGHYVPPGSRGSRSRDL